MSYPCYVYKLTKYLYGLKRVPRSWHARIVGYLVSIGFHMACADHLLHVQENDKDIIIICIYADDLIVGGYNEAKLENVNIILKKEFYIQDLGELWYFFGH